MCPSMLISSEHSMGVALSDSPNMTTYVGAVVACPGGRVLCQLRDDKPGIQFPDFWTCSPGGHVEQGEPPQSAILRELREEFEIEVTGLRHMLTLTEHDYNVKGVYHAFTATLATPVDQVRCNEGQCVRFFEPGEILCLHKLHPISLKIFQAYLEYCKI